MKKYFDCSSGNTQRLFSLLARRWLRSNGSTREEVESQMREAIEFHLEGMARSGQLVPEPHTYSAYVEVSAQAH